MKLIFILVYAMAAWDTSEYCKRASDSSYCKSRYPIETRAIFFKDKTSAVVEYRKLIEEKTGARLFEVDAASGTAREIVPPASSCEEQRSDIKVH